MFLVVDSDREEWALDVVGYSKIPLVEAMEFMFEDGPREEQIEIFNFSAPEEYLAPRISMTLEEVYCLLKLRGGKEYRAAAHLAQDGAGSFVFSPNCWKLEPDEVDFVVVWDDSASESYVEDYLETLGARNHVSRGIECAELKVYPSERGKVRASPSETLRIPTVANDMRSSLMAYGFAAYDSPLYDCRICERDDYYDLDLDY